MNESSQTPADQLKALLQGLCSSDDDRGVLEALCSKVKSFGASEVEFKNFSFEYTVGASAERAASLPKSFVDISDTVTSLVWDGGGPEVGFELGEEGLSTADGWIFDELEEEDKAPVLAAGGAKDAFVGGQNALFFDPIRTLSNGEPALAFVSHGEVEWAEVTSADKFDYKQIFLRMIADQMIGTSYFPEIYF